MSPSPSILTNQAFRESPTWMQATTSICRDGESPDVLPPLQQAFRLLKLRKKFDVVVTMGPRPSLAYGLLCAVLGLSSKQILTEVFLDAPRPASPVWRLKTALFRWISRRALGILTNSSAEIGLIAQRFRIAEDHLRFVPMYTTLPTPGPRESNDGTVVSIGRTLRDVDTLVEAARHIPAPVIIVSGRDDPLPANLPTNVRVLREIPLVQSHELIARCAVAAAPLLPAERSTGQVFIFEAMAMGKPVVATRAVGTVDYLRDGENGLLVEPGDAPGLALAINRILQNATLARRLGQSALADCQTLLDKETHAWEKIEAIRSLWHQAHPGNRIGPD